MAGKIDVDEIEQCLEAALDACAEAIHQAAPDPRLVVKLREAVERIEAARAHVKVK